MKEILTLEIDFSLVIVTLLFLAYLFVSCHQLDYVCSNALQSMSAFHC